MHTTDQNMENMLANSGMAMPQAIFTQPRNNTEQEQTPLEFSDGPRSGSRQELSSSEKPDLAGTFKNSTLNNVRAYQSGPIQEDQPTEPLFNQDIMSYSQEEQKLNLQE